MSDSQLIKENFQKLFVIDINPGNDDVTKDLVLGKLSNVLKNISKYQHVVIISHSTLSLLKKLVKDLNIERGFVISDNGARIYSIHEDQVLFDDAIDKDDALALVHFGIMQNSLLLISGNQREYAYGLNLSDASSLNRKHYLPLSHTNDYNKLVKFINSTVIHSVLIYRKNRYDMLKALDKFNRIAKDWSFAAAPGQQTYFVVTNKNINKYTGILQIMQHVGISSVDRVYYYALNAINHQCVKAFKNYLIHQDIALASSYYADIDAQADTDNVIANISQAFFSNSESINETYSAKEIIDTKKLNLLMKESNRTKK